MVMRTTPNNFTIADYSEQLKNSQITINHDYQRTNKVWPISAKSNLIDTILSGYPIPKLILSQATDLDTRRTRKEVVDGQQRTAAIIEFLQNEFTLTRGDFAGHSFETLDDEKKREFLDYQLSADVFTSARDEEIRELFRRINSYQVPLNKQETRNATHQGEFKWFIRELGKQYATSFRKIGMMSEKQLSRMADLEFLTELVSLVEVGIRTFSPKQLDTLYTKYDNEFPQREVVENQIRYGLGQIIDLREIHETRLMSRENAYSLFAAFIAINYHASPVKMDIENEEDKNRNFVEKGVAIGNITALADALDDEPPHELRSFSDAAKQGTNTQKNRRTRFRWFHKAMTAERL